MADDDGDYGHDIRAETILDLDEQLEMEQGFDEVDESLVC